MTHPCLSTIERQAAVLEAALRQEVGDHEPWTLLDFPDHSNIGDSAIWVGEYKALKRITGREASYVATCRLDPLAKEGWRNAPGQILLHGGGNFGDLYPLHQNYRLAVLEALPGRRIVQLAQSIHFSSLAALKQTADVVKAHGNFCLFARDTATYEFATQHFECEVKLVPDGAFGMGPLSRTRAPTLETLQFRREDIEAVGGSTPDSVDWPKEDFAEARRHEWPGPLHHLVRGNLSRTARRRAGMNAVAEWRLGRGLDLLSSAHEIVCDRLHVHILSTLLGIPHRFSDNSTGKISAYYNTWTNDCGIGRPV